MSLGSQRDIPFPGARRQQDSAARRSSGNPTDVTLLFTKTSFRCPVHVSKSSQWEELRGVVKTSEGVSELRHCAMHVTGREQSVPDHAAILQTARHLSDKRLSAFSVMAKRQDNDYALHSIDIFVLCSAGS